MKLVESSWNGSSSMASAWTGKEVGLAMFGNWTLPRELGNLGANGQRDEKNYDSV